MRSQSRHIGQCDTGRPVRLLFVDDDPWIADLVSLSLRGARPNWDVVTAMSVDAAMSRLEEGPVDVILTDVAMPEKDGFALIEQVHGSPGLRDTPIIVLTGASDAAVKRRALDAGAVDLLTKPVEIEDLIARVSSALRMKWSHDALHALNETLERRVSDRTLDLEQAQTDSLLCLAMAGECRDSDTGHHLIRVAHYSRRLAQEFGLTQAEVEAVFKASPLHDIGKLGVPDHILGKQGKLDDEERKLMQRHCEVGYRILRAPVTVAGAMDIHGAGSVRRQEINPLLDLAAEIALLHHERWDGNGYPRGLKKNEISLGARIVMIADVYDAMTTRRCYKPAMTHEHSVEMLFDNAGKHFDPELVDVFRRIETEFDRIRRDWTDAEDHPDEHVLALGRLMAPSWRAA